MAKEHEIEFHDNPNYVIVRFPNGAPITRSRDKFTSITEEKDLEDDSANFIMAMSPGHVYGFQ